MRRDRVSAFVTWASGWGAGVCLLALVFAGTLQVFCRYVLNAPLRWPEEMSRLLFIWLTYIGALVLPELRMHVAVAVLYDRMPSPGRWALDLLANLLGAAFFAALAIGGVALVRSMVGILLPATQLPMNLVFGLIPVVAALQVYMHLVSAIRLLHGRTDTHVAGSFTAPEAY